MYYCVYIMTLLCARLLEYLFNKNIVNYILKELGMEAATSEASVSRYDEERSDEEFNILYLRLYLHLHKQLQIVLFLFL